MATYFRITAYHPQENVSVIMDSNGMFEKRWQFSAHLVSKGFQILEVGEETSPVNGSLDHALDEPDRMILRACAKGKPVYKDGCVYVSGRYYKPASND